MNALPSPEPHQPQSPRPRQRRKSQRLQATHRAITWEISIKLAVNSILSVVATVTLVKLLPYQGLQQAKLREIDVEVQESERRVNQLRKHFTRNFDSRQTRKVMQEQSPRIDPNQRRIFWLTSSPNKP